MGKAVARSSPFILPPLGPNGPSVGMTKQGRDISRPYSERGQAEHWWGTIKAAFGRGGTCRGATESGVRVRYAVLMTDNETLEKRGLWLSIIGALFNLALDVIFTRDPRWIEVSVGGGVVSSERS